MHIRHYTWHVYLRTNSEEVIHDDTVHENSEALNNLFKDYFIDIGTNIAVSIGGNTYYYLDYMAQINQLIIFFFSLDTFIIVRLKEIFVLSKINHAIWIQFLFKS